MKEQTPVQEPPKKKKLERVYDYLKVKKVKVPDNYASFEKSMGNDENLKKVHGFLVESKAKVEPDFEEFKLNSFPDLKKKEEQQPAQQAIPLPHPDVQPENTITAPESDLGTGDPKQSSSESVIPQETLAALSEQLANPKDPEELRFDYAMKRKAEEEAREYVGRISHPENYMESNPIVSFGKKAWQTLRYDMPAALGSAMALHRPGGILGTFDKDIDKEHKIIKAETVEWANKLQAEGAPLSKDLVDSLDKIEDPIDFLNWASTAVGQAGVQIPASIATGGATSFGQEAGGIYLASVNRIAKERGITPTQVIEQELDEPGIALTYGAVAGALDYIGAKGAFGGFSKEMVGKSLRERALATIKSGVIVEPGTEYFQTWIEQVAEEQSAGKSFADAVEFALNDPTKRQERLEATAQALVPGAAGTAVSTLTKTNEQANSKGETVGNENSAAPTEEVGAEPEQVEPTQSASGEVSESPKSETNGEGQRGQGQQEELLTPQEEQPSGESTPPDVVEPVENKKALLNRAYEGKNSEVVKKAIEKHGLTYETETHVEAKEKADAFIEEVGLENAIDAIRGNQVEDGAAAFVWAKAIDDVQDQIANTTDDGEIARLSELQADLVSEFDVKARSGGRFISALQEVYRLSDFNYNADRQIEKYKEVNAGEISPDIESKFKELEGQLKEVNTKLKAAEAEATKLKSDEQFMRISKQFNDEKATRKKAATANKQQINDFFDSLKIKDVGGTANDITRVLGSAVWNGSIEAVRTATLAGYDVANAVQAGIEYIKQNYKGEGFNQEEYINAVAPKLTRALPKTKQSKIGSPVTKAGKLTIPESLIKKVVQDGAQNIDELTDTIHKIVSETKPDVTIREVRDAITKYGQTKNLSQDEVKKKVREFKNIGRLVSKLEDVNNKIRPLRSGLQRDKLTDEARRLGRNLREAMKGLPVDQAQLDKELKTALDAVKSRLKNQITDLEDQIATGEKTPDKKGIEYDAEALALKEQRDKLKETLESIEGKRDVPIEEKINRAAGMIQKSIDELERRIKAGELETPAKKEGLKSDRLDALKAQRDDLKATLKKMQDDTGMTERKRLAAAKAVAKSSASEYERRIKEGDFARRKKVEITSDDELSQLRAHKLAVKNEFDKLQYQAELKNRTTREKVIDAMVEVWGLTRALRATGEFSFVLLQGGALTLSHPVEAANAFATAMSHFASEQRHEDWLNNIKSQEYYERAKASKLAITEPNAKLTAREESFLGGWVNHIWDVLGLPIKIAGKSAYNTWKKLNPAKAVERAGIGYLNTLRLARYLQGEEMLEKAGKTFRENPEDYKNMADVINTFTGRASLGPLEMMAKPLSIVFFSPRMWASTLKQATPYAFYHFGKMGSKTDPWYKPSVAQKMAAADYMRYVALTGSVVALVAASQDDDDPDGWKVEMDRRSSDFLKLRRGNTTVDPWGGRQQMVVLQARLWANAIKNYKGEIVPLGTPYKSDTKMGLIMRMVQNKLAPSASLVNKALSSHTKKLKKVEVRVDQYGNLLNMEDELANNLYPIYWETIAELHEDQPSTVAGFLDFLAFFGIGTQTFDPVNDKKKNREKIKEILKQQRK